MKSQSPEALFILVPWIHAIRAVLIAGIFCAGGWGVVAVGDKSLSEQMSTLLPVTLAALSCIIVAFVSAWGCRWSFYPDSIVLSRFGLWKTELSFRNLDSLHIRVDDEDKPLAAAVVTKIRQRIDGETPAVFYIVLHGKDTTGMPASLHLSSNDFNKHEEARWAVSYLLGRCPMKKRRIDSLSGNIDGLIRVVGRLIKWTVLFIGFAYLWDHYTWLLAEEKYLRISSQ